MVYLAVRPKASAARNFAGGYWSAPAKNKNGGDGRRQHSGDGDSEESPAFEGFVEFLNFATWKLFLDRFLAAGAGDAVGEEAAEEGTDSGHEGVIKPEILLRSGQKDGGDIHGARHGDGGVIEKAERD